MTSETVFAIVVLFVSVPMGICLLGFAYARFMEWHHYRTPDSWLAGVVGVVWGGSLVGYASLAVSYLAGW